jgi:hypothetical protein
MAVISFSGNCAASLSLEQKEDDMCRLSFYDYLHILMDSALHCLTERSAGKPGQTSFDFLFERRDGLQSFARTTKTKGKRRLEAHISIARGFLTRLLGTVPSHFVSTLCP